MLVSRGAGHRIAVMLVGPLDKNCEWKSKRGTKLTYQLTEITVLKILSRCLFSLSLFSPEVLLLRGYISLTLRALRRGKRKERKNLSAHSYR